jgi:hypothetical protein
MRRLALTVGAALAAAVVALPSSGATRATGGSWLGTWDTTYGQLVVTGSGTSLNGAFGYSDSYNEPLGHLTGTANGDTFAGTWSHDPPSHFAPRDHGNFTFTLALASGGKLTFKGTGTYAVDNSTFEWTGTCKSGACAADLAPPKVTGFKATGTAGTTVRIGFSPWDESGKAYEIVTLYQGSKVLVTARTKLQTADYSTTSVTVRAPKVKGTYRYSVVAIDGAGHKSPVAWSTLTLS